MSCARSTRGAFWSARRAVATCEPAPRRTRCARRHPDSDRAFDRDVFLLRERVFTITSKYEVWAEDGTPILYVERPTYPVRTLVAYLVGRHRDRSTAHVARPSGPSGATAARLLVLLSTRWRRSSSW